MAKKKSVTSRIFLTVLVNVVIGVSVLIFTPGLPPFIRFESYKLTKAVHLPQNNKLDNAELLITGEFAGPESIAQRGNEIFTGVRGQGIIRIKNGEVKPVVRFGSASECKLDWDEESCGRVLGLRFHSNGKLIAADAYFGLFSIDVDTGKYTTLVSSGVEIGGKAPMIPDDLDISKSGLIYWSDASTEAKLYNSVVEYFGGPTGRFLVYDPKTNSSKVLMEHLHFPNGVQLSKDEEFVLVAETMRARVWRYHLKGPNAGKSEIFVDGLPGLPDNIRPNGVGGYYVSLVVARDKTSTTPGDALGTLPLIRKLILRIQGLAHGVFDWLDDLIPGLNWLKATKYYIGHMGPLGHPDSYSPKVIIIELDNNGKIIGSLQTQRNTQMRLITEVSVGPDYTYFGSYIEDKLWRIKTSELK